MHQLHAANSLRALGVMRSGGFVPQEPNRLIAEIQYKIALAQQYLNEPEKALVSCRAALATCRDRIAHLKTLQVAAPQTLDGAAVAQGNEIDVAASAADGEALPEDAMTVDQEAAAGVDNADGGKAVQAVAVTMQDPDQEAIEKVCLANHIATQVSVCVLWWCPSRALLRRTGCALGSGALPRWLEQM
jgi:hypothetical protein